jgi:hypothetical protein
MSGGDIKPQQSGEHQVVIFTFAGTLNQSDVDEWNKQILALKARFGSNVMVVTIKGEPSLTGKP